MATILYGYIPKEKEIKAEVKKVETPKKETTKKTNKSKGE